MLYEFKILQDPDEVQSHLDGLNEAGYDTTVVGRDARDLPFIVHLIGQYADVTNVYMYDPWDWEIDVPLANRECDDCNARGALKLEHLSYPVTLMVMA